MKYTEPISKILPADKAQISATNFKPLINETRFTSSCFKISATKFEPFISVLFLKRVLSSILALLIISLGVGIVSVSAQNYTPLVPLPGTVAQGGSTTNLSSYLSGMIKLLIALGGALAILFAIIGGTQYVAASTNPSLKEGAKERIMGALIGLAIILTSYLLLNSINPKLVQFNLALEPVTPKALKTFPSTDNTATGICGSLTPLDTVAQKMENGSNVIWGPVADVDQGINDNLAKLRQEDDKLSTSLNKIGITATETSVYRPLSYQLHLYEVWSLHNSLANNTAGECAYVKSAIDAEFKKHKLGSAVADPSGSICGAPHMKGTGIDLVLTYTNSGNKITDYNNIGLNGENGNGTTGINNFMHNTNLPQNGGVNIDLSWQRISGDTVHFNLVDPPYTPPGC